MKKFYSLMLALVVGISFISAQCTIDQNNTTEFDPNPNNVPPASMGVPYDEVIQFYIPTSTVITVATFGVTAYIDSVVLNNVSGLPTGLNWSKNPAGPTFLPGSNGCGRTQGTTTVAAGNYPISFDGRIYFHVDTVIFTFPVQADTSITIDEYLQQKYGKTFSIDVVDPNGIKDFNPELNSIISVYPNPNTGVFTFSLNTSNRINGEVVVVDVTGRKVFTQMLDVTGLYTATIDLTAYSKGIYTLQLRTAEGFASKNISIE